DVLRALVFGVLALSTPATPVLLLISVLAGLATVPFEAARSAATLDVTPADQLPAAMSLGQATQSLALVVGWGVGGLLLVGIGTHGAFAVNAATFALSALLLSRLPSLRADSATEEDSAEAALSATRRLVAAVQAVSTDTLVRRAALVAVLAVGPATAAEALIVPFVSRTWSSHPSLAAALLAGGAILDLVLTVAIRCTLPPEQLVRIAAWCCAAPAAVAVLLFSTGNPVLSAAGFVVSSMSLTAIAPASAALAPRLPIRLRASCFTVLATALTLTQVVLSTAGGALADLLGTTVAARALMLLPVAAGLAAVLRSAPSALPELEPAR
ncbi:MAG TPA: MFS transporter, partial [Mycobacteriales bacterium]|nr:MFS transporter [Mycobacteriales bacterium]